MYVFRKVGVFWVKKRKHSPIDGIVNHRKGIEKLFVLLVLFSLLCAPFVGVNFDLTVYLPDYAPSSQALDIMEQEFTYPGMARVMLTDVSLYEAKAYKDRIEAVDGVDSVLWCDTETNILGSDAFIDYSNIEDYYKDNCAYMDVTFVEKDASTETHRAVNEIQTLLGDKGVIAGSAASDTMLGPTINAQVAKVMVVALFAIYLILTLTTTSWFEPILFLMVMFIAIIINNGTNIFLGTISFMTNAVASVLQLAISMDYSIFLLHSFTHEKANGIEPEQAMANALRTSFVSIMSSGATTIAGFLALTLMEFTIGRDMGLVLAKGIVISLLTVILLMPALILRFQSRIEKTAHRSFMPSFRKLGEVVYKLRIPVFVLLALLVVPSYVGQGMCDFTYGNEAITNSEGTEVYQSEQLMNAKFGKSNMMLALVPVGDNVREKELTDTLEDLPYVKNATSLAGTLPEGLPEEFLPSSLTEDLHSAHWSRLLISVNSGGESEAAFAYADEVRQTIADAYPDDQTYLIGTTPSTEDIRDIIKDDYAHVNVLSLLGVALVIAVAFRSIVLPIVVLIPIETAVFINMVIPYISGQRLMFLGYIICSCVQLGATVDYSILLTGNYLDARSQGDRKEAAIRSVTTSALSVLTSGIILTLIGYGLYFLTTIDAVATLGEMIGRGALLSVILVLFLLPICLMIFDKLIVKQDYATKKHATMNRIRATKLIRPKVSALKTQARELHRQIHENRKARRQAFLRRLRGKKAQEPAPEEEMQEETQEQLPPDPVSSAPEAQQTTQEPVQSPTPVQPEQEEHSDEKKSEDET